MFCRRVGKSVRNDSEYSYLLELQLVKKIPLLSREQKFPRSDIDELKSYIAQAAMCVYIVPVIRIIGLRNEMDLCNK